MRKIKEIRFLESFQIECLFDNDEHRILDLKSSLQGPKKFVDRVLTRDNFNKAQIGKHGEIFWENLAEMKDENGEKILCDYDISPDYAYLKSRSMETSHD